MGRHDEPSVATLEVALATLERWSQVARCVIVVAIDGHGASGKSTIAKSLAELTGASVVHTDDFYCPDLRSQAALGSVRALESFYDLGRLRGQALEPLRSGREAIFRVFDWGTGELSQRQESVSPSGVLLLEGVCSASLQLGDLVDKAICVAAPEAERLVRLRQRVAPEEWDEEWLAAEREYFGVARPLKSFDLCVSGCASALQSPRVVRAPDGGRRTDAVCSRELGR